MKVWVLTQPIFSCVTHGKLFEHSITYFIDEVFIWIRGIVIVLTYVIVRIRKLICQKCRPLSAARWTQTLKIGSFYGIKLPISSLWPGWNEEHLNSYNTKMPHNTSGYLLHDMAMPNTAYFSSSDHGQYSVIQLPRSYWAPAIFQVL